MKIPGLNLKTPAEIFKMTDQDILDALKLSGPAVLAETLKAAVEILKLHHSSGFVRGNDLDILELARSFLIQHFTKVQD